MYEKEINRLLGEQFNIGSFRPLQKEIINSITSRRNTLGILQTGSGKSLTYQLPSQFLPGLTIVVSPLISLMKDQVNELNKLGIESGSINYMSEDIEKHQILTKIYNNEIKIIFLSPEKLLEQKFLQYIVGKGVEVSLIVVDEAHCISQWGNNFRDSYANLENLKFDYNEIPILLLTGSATKKVVNDIKDKFIIEDEDVFIGSFLKENIDYEMILKGKNPDKQTLDLIKKHPGDKGIVYCNTRKEVEKVTEFLVKKGVNAKKYHAGLENFDREQTQEEYTNGNLDIIVATTAFGMGINVPDIRFVIHYNTPYSIENFYQETGRAGRDGLDSFCYLLFSPKDVAKTKFYISRESDFDSLNNFKDMASYVMSTNCRKKSLLAHFGEIADFDNCGKCDICKRNEETLKITDSSYIIKTIADTIVNDCHNERSIGTVRDILIGSKVKKIKDEFEDSVNYGVFKDKYSKEMVEYFLYSLIVDDILHTENRKIDSYSWEVVYVPNNSSITNNNHFINQPIFDF